MKKRESIERSIINKATLLGQLEKEEDTATEEQRIQKQIKSHQVKRTKVAVDMKSILQKLINTVLEQDFCLVKRLENTSKLQELKNRDTSTDHEFKLLKRKAEESMFVCLSISLYYYP
jgi:hypothetical protein